MGTLSISPPYPTFTDVDGDPLEDGYIYIGAAGFAAESSPITVYWDAELTVAASQPIRTLGGYPSNSGSPGRLYCDKSDYSITIKNKNSTLVHSTTNQTDYPTIERSKNQIINGRFDFWQRATSQTTNGYGSADRWRFEQVGSTKTASRQSFTEGQTDVPGNPRYYCRTVVSSVAGAANYIRNDHRVEGVRGLSGKTITLTFWAKADASRNMAIEFVQVMGTGGSPSSDADNLGVTKLALTTSWALYTVTIDMPSLAGKTIGTNNNDSIKIRWWFDAGSNYNANTDTLGQQSGTFDVAQVKLELGAIATSVEPVDYQEELARCQRFYTKSYDVETVPGTVTDNGNVSIAASGTITQRAVVFSTFFKVKMRSVPNITLYSPATGNSGNMRDVTGATDRAVVAANIGEEKFNALNNETVTDTYLYSMHYTAEAEI